LLANAVMGLLLPRPPADHEGILVSDARYEKIDLRRVRIPDMPRRSEARMTHSEAPTPGVSRSAGSLISTLVVTTMSPMVRPSPAAPEAAA
jgi:hypothetical protein